MDSFCPAVRTDGCLGAPRRTRCRGLSQAQAWRAALPCGQSACAVDARHDRRRAALGARVQGPTERGGLRGLRALSALAQELGGAVYELLDALPRGAFEGLSLGQGLQCGLQGRLVDRPRRQVRLPGLPARATQLRVFHRAMRVDGEAARMAPLPNQMIAPDGPQRVAEAVVVFFRREVGKGLQLLWRQNDFFWHPMVIRRR